jgi:hypothetical protein
MTVARKIVRRIQSAPADIAYRLSALPPIHGMLRRRHLQRAALAAGAPAPDGMADLLEALEHEAVALTHLDALDLAGTADFLCAAEGLFDRAIGEARERPFREDVTLCVSADPLYAPIYRWGLDARLLALVAAYLGSPVAYDGCELVYTPLTSGEGGARVWHRDREDWRVLKLIVYLDDVGPGHAPLQILNRGAHAGSIEGMRGYPLIREREIVQRMGCPIDADHVTTCIGPAGTVVLTDGARYFHRRKPPENGDRRAAMFSYFARCPRNPYYCNRSRLSPAQIRAMTADLPPAQQAAARWREGLRFPLSIIPASLR